jgi:hypothetical protein
MIRIVRASTAIALVLAALLLTRGAIHCQDVATRPLGVFTLSARTTDCPAGFTCNQFTVSCPNVRQVIPGAIAIRRPVVPIAGMVVFFSGSGGGKWWQGTSTLVPPFFQSLLTQGLILVQVRWGGSGWLSSASGEVAGQEALACRPATAIKWIHDTLYLPLRLTPPRGKCGFCLTGNSGGSAAIAYALSSYGLDGMVNAMVPTSGPPLAALAKGCLQYPGYGYDAGGQALIDSSYGYNDAVSPGPCRLNEQSFYNAWVMNSVETGGVDYYYANTRVKIIVGGHDSVIIRNHASDYFNVLAHNQQPMLTWLLVPNMGHPIIQSQDGLNALLAALTQ